MNTIDFEPIIEKIRAVVASHRLADGSYKRFLSETEPNPYGCADAANILYTIGDFPRDPNVRAEFVKNLLAMQSEDGMFHEKTHIPFHTTAHCLAALELFDFRVSEPIAALEKYRDIDALIELLDMADRSQNARGHMGAAIYVIMNLAEMVGDDWNRAYFKWFWDNTDPETGLWHTQGTYSHDPLWQYMGDGFHYLFNIEYAKMPIRYPERLIDSCIRIYDEPNGMPSDFGVRAHFLEADWIYCLNRASRQTPYRFYEIKDRLRRFKEDYYSYLCTVDFETDRSFNDLHLLFGVTCALAELQQALPGELHTNKPLRLVLERRPFI